MYESDYSEKPAYHGRIQSLIILFSAIVVVLFAAYMIRRQITVDLEPEKCAYAIYYHPDKGLYRLNADEYLEKLRLFADVLNGTYLLSSFSLDFNNSSGGGPCLLSLYDENGTEIDTVSFKDGSIWKTGWLIDYCYSPQEGILRTETLEAFFLKNGTNVNP